MHDKALCRVIYHEVLNIMFRALKVVHDQNQIFIHRTKNPCTASHTIQYSRLRDNKHDKALSCILSELALTSLSRAMASHLQIVQTFMTTIPGNVPNSSHGRWTRYSAVWMGRWTQIKCGNISGKHHLRGLKSIATFYGQKKYCPGGYYL